MSLHRIILGGSKINLSLRKAFYSPMRNLSYFPLGREPSSLPTMKLDPKSTPYGGEDDRPISLRFRVSSMIELSQLDKAAQISRLAVSDEYVDLPCTVPMICNKIIGAMYGAKRYDDAIALFHYFFNKSDLIPDASTYNLIIKVHCDENNVDHAFELYHYAKRLAVMDNTLYIPDIDTHIALVIGLLKAGRILDALGFVKTQKLWDPEVYSCLVRGFLDLGIHGKAYELFHEFDHQVMLHHSEDQDIRRAAVEATFVEYWFKQDQYIFSKDEKAMEIYSSVTKKDLYINTGNALLEILFGNGKKREAWELFERMITNPKTFDTETFKIMVKECFELKEFKLAVETFKRPELTRSSRCYAEIISRFCALGMMSEARGLFEEVSSDEHLCPDVPTFRSMINGYAKVGKVDDAVEMLKKMVDATLLNVAVTEAQ